MKLCSICDKKIAGKWCKNCHRFVKSYDLPNGIYLNESHNPSNDAGCTYHAVPEQPAVTYGKQNEVSGRTVSGTTGNRNGKNTSGKNAGKKIAAIVGVFYALVAVIGIIGNVVSEKSHGVEEEIGAEFSEYVSDDDLLWTEPEGLAPELDNLLLGMKEKIDALEQIEPAEVSVEADYEFRYYFPEQIKEIGFSCSEAHFSKTLYQFDKWLSENWTNEFEAEEDVSEFYNYFYLDDEYVWMTFVSFRDYYAGDDFAVRANYDTATEELHTIGFVSTMEKDARWLMYLALKEFDPDTNLTEEEFFERIEKALEDGEYVTFYESEFLEADCEVKDGMYSVSFYPAYTE